jgi:hypothetical protein
MTVGDAGQQGEEGAQFVQPKRRGNHMGASQHVARHQEEAWRLPTMIVEKTCLTLGICLGLALITASIPLALNHQKMSEETSYDWIISEADSSMHMDAVSSAIHTTSGSSRRRRRLYMLFD